MLANTTTILASDGTKMQGIHYRVGEPSNKVVIHVHGMAGNFYENSFIEVIAMECNKRGIDFLAFNNRGHDYIADCERITSDGTESYSAGGAYEVFTECLFDLEGVLQWAINEGYSSVYLQGHSSGANKIAFSYDKLMEEDRYSKVLKGIVFISPCDDIGIYYSETAEGERNKSFELAKKYIQEGNGQSLMPLGTFFDYLLSANTFVECFTDRSPLDMFPYRLGTLDNTKVSRITLPILVQFGNNGDFVLQEFSDIEKMYAKIMPHNFKLEIVNNAGHNYKNYEVELSNNIVHWIEEIEQ